jgi:hypothetical protein
MMDRVALARAFLWLLEVITLLRAGHAVAGLQLLPSSQLAFFDLEKYMQFHGQR